MKAEIGMHGASPVLSQVSVDNESGLNRYDDAFSHMARSAHHYHLLGPWLIARVAQSYGAEVEWLTRAMMLVQQDDRQVFFWDVRSNESSVGAKLATHKGHTHRFLERAGVAAPAARQVQGVEAALAFWRGLGCPVVVKPVQGTRGRAVALGLDDESSIREAFAQAQSERGVLVEEQVQGSEYRFFVVGGEVLAVLGKDPAHVVGDGIATVEALVEAKNQLRAMNPRLMTGLIPLDEVASRNLHRQGVDWQSVPRSGQRVVLRQEANISMGADTFDATDLVSQRSKSIAVAAVQALPGLDWAGVDVMLADSADEQGDVRIIEVNTCPGLGGHHFPMRGQPRDVATAVWQRALAKQQALGEHFAIALLPECKPEYCQLRVELGGKVQMVGYRKWLKKIAIGLGVEGWVRNLPSGKIQAGLYGERSVIERLLGKLSFGPSRAVVKSINQVPLKKPLRRSGFRILRTPAE